MADVTVEFGATDTGLEKTLKAVQDELNGLKTKVKSGELSMTELEGTMKRIGQVTSMEKNIKAIGDQSQGTSTQVKALGTAAEDTGKKGEIGFGKIAVGATLAGAAAKVGSMAIDAAFSAALKTVQSFGAALDMGGRLVELSDRTGIAVDRLLLLERAFHNAGVGADAVGPIINKMQKALVDAEDGTSKAAYAFADLGLSLSKLRAMSPEEQLKAIGDAIASIPNEAERTAISIELFGKSGGKLNQLFVDLDGGIKVAKNQLGSLPALMKGASEQFDRIDENLFSVGQKFVEFAAGLLDKVAPALDAVTTGLSMIDTAGIGQEIGEFFVGAGKGMKIFQDAVDAFETGNLVEGFKLVWKGIVQQAQDTANSIYTNIVAGFKTAGDFIGKMFKSDGALFTTVLDGARLIGKKITEEISMSLAKVFLGSVLTKGLSDSLADASYTAKAEGTIIETALIGSGRRIKEQFNEAGNSIGSTFNKNLKDTPPLFDNIIKKQDDVVKKNKEIIDSDKEWEAQAMARIDKDIDAAQKAFKEKRANQQTLTKDQSAEDERAANARKKYEDDHKVQAQMKRDQIADQIKINDAIANGDTKLADSLKNTQALNKTIKELADAGLNEATKEAEKLANELARSAREADRVKNSLATKIGEKIKSKEETEAVDPGGRLMRKAQEQIEKGQYKAAEATGQQLAARELQTSVSGAGAGRDMRAATDILKDYYGNKAPASLTRQEELELVRLAREEGVFKDFSKMTDRTQKGLDRFADVNGKSAEKTKEGAEKMKEAGNAIKNGMKPPQAAPSTKTPTTKMSLEAMVEAIKTAVVSLEKKLPQPVLA